MPRKSSRGRRPFEIVMDELATEQDSWDLEQHLTVAPKFVAHGETSLSADSVLT
jgi:hypothetical protein